MTRGFAVARAGLEPASSDHEPEMLPIAPPRSYHLAFTLRNFVRSFPSSVIVFLLSQAIPFILPTVRSRTVTLLRLRSS